MSSAVSVLLPTFTPLGSWLATVRLRNFLQLERERRGTTQSGTPSEGEGSSGHVVLGIWAVLFLLVQNLRFMMPGEGVLVPGAHWVGLVGNYLAARL